MLRRRTRRKRKERIVVGMKTISDASTPTRNRFATETNVRGSLSNW